MCRATKTGILPFTPTHSNKHGVSGAFTMLESTHLPRTVKQAAHIKQRFTTTIISSQNNKCVSSGQAAA